MPAPDVTLNSGQVLLTQTSSLLSIDASGTGLQFGEVELVSELDDRFSVGDVVLFDPKDANQLSFSGAIYFLTTEDKIFFNEQPPV
jgi:hypothetical protein